eukprot:TRINITY_DN16646_c0_g1_i1.p2 TRINITY_DN16646_c0_g1~~TRINITY_DN16646_c0_g1_i1.p2  ORF type:complete len:114 (-),score=19.27 TRINITY_DN16646_c0_g1_i1:194-535(-)
MKSFSSSSFANDHAEVLDLALAAVNKHPQALFTDFQWFLYEARDTVFFTAASKSHFDKETLGNLVADMVALAPTKPWLSCGARATMSATRLPRVSLSKCDFDAAVKNTVSRAS